MSQIRNSLVELDFSGRSAGPNLNGASLKWTLIDGTLIIANSCCFLLPKLGLCVCASGSCFHMHIN